MSLLLDLIFPRQCYSCGKLGRYLCLDCQSKIVVHSVKPHQRLSLFKYHNPIKSLIHDLKFEFVSDIVPEVSLLISRTLKTKFPHLLKFWQDENYILVPIPLHSRRLSWRGFNQSELIAQQLSLLINLKYKNILIRTQNTLPQTSLKDKVQRHQNISSAFRLNGSMTNGSMVKYILFDDVYTTGSTIKSAISCFPSNSDIWILTLAG